MESVESTPQLSEEHHEELELEQQQEDEESHQNQQQHQDQQEQNMSASNEDLEDGEIEDDDEDVQQQEEPSEKGQNVPQNAALSACPPVSQSPHAANNPDVGEHRVEGKFGDRPENKFGSPNNRFHDKYRDRRNRFERRDGRGRGEERGGKHLTEAEKSVMYLHKLERMEREKRERIKREQGAIVDDFASNIEKAIANVLKKEQKEKEGSNKTSDEEKEDTKRGKKRKKKDKDKDKKKLKQRRMDSPKSDEIDEQEFLNVRGGNSEIKTLGSPKERSLENSRSPSRSDCEGSNDTDSSDRSREDSKEDKKRDRSHHKRNSKSRNKDRRNRKRRDHSKEKNEPPLKDAQNICVFYMQGKCHKGDECPYSHEVLPPMKLELCKFYLMDCCAKGDKCLYMHSEFPCKFYHTGLKCYAEDKCKFAHGKPLSEGLKQILFKHIETAPKEILGDFPRLTRDGAINMINQTQKNLEAKFGIEKKDSSERTIPSLFDINVSMPSELQNEGDQKLKDKTEKGVNRERKSRWQDADPSETAAALQEQQIQMALRIKGFYTERDQDMRITSNGDVDMRTLAPHLSTLPLQIPPPLVGQSIMSFAKMPQNMQTATVSHSSEPVSFSQDVDIRNTTSFFDNKDVDIRQPPTSFMMDVDSRQIDFAKDVDIRPFGPPLTTNISSVIEGSSVKIINAEADDNGDEPNLEIVVEDENREQQKTVLEVDSNRVLGFDSVQQTVSVNKDVDNRVFGGLSSNLPPNLPKKQMELFLRIQAQQKDNVPDVRGPEPEDNDDANVDWYSDDDDDCRLTIKDDVEDPKQKAEEKPETPAPSFISPSLIKPNEVMEKLGDLSKIDISAEVTKLLSSISQGTLSPKEPKLTAPKDPRLAAQTASTTATVPLVSSVDVPKISPADPRRSRLSSTENKAKESKLSIYEQGSLSLENAKKDVDLRAVGKDTDLRGTLGDLDLRAGGRPDIDLRHLNLPFKAIQNYTPATEIDASVNSHPPIAWKIIQVEIPQPDYTGLKLNVQEAQNTGDPRLRKIFRLNSEEKDSPASPKENVKPAPARVDPRRRKMEENKSADTTQMSYSQQLSMLQNSAFYQSLTSNQKVLLNQELATKADGSGSHDPMLAGLLTNLGILPAVPSSSAATTITPNSSVLNILTNIGNAGIGPMGQNPNLMGPNPALLGQNPNIPGAGPQGLITSGPGQNLPGIISQNPNFVNPNILSQNPNVVGPGLLGPSPSNIPGDFQLNFDPRQGGLLGNAPIDFPPHNLNFGNEDYYQDGGGGGGGGGFGGGGVNNRSERNFNRDRQQQRRGRNFNNRSNRGRDFRNRNLSRSNRSRTPP